MVFGHPAGAIPVFYRIEEELLCITLREAQSWKGDSVLCSEEIPAFQLTTGIFFKEVYYV